MFRGERLQWTRLREIFRTWEADIFVDCLVQRLGGEARELIGIGLPEGGRLGCFSHAENQNEPLKCSPNGHATTGASDRPQAWDNRGRLRLQGGNGRDRADLQFGRRTTRKQPP